MRSLGRALALSTGFVAGLLWVHDVVSFLLALLGGIVLTFVLACTEPPIE